MAIKRTTLPRWATDDVINPTSGLNNVTEPSEAKKDLGWDYLEKPARQYFNWIGRQSNQWLEYLDDVINLYAPYETDPKTMSVQLNKGHINIGTDVLHIAAQVSPLLTVPLVNPRIDRIVIAETTGLIAVVVGTEAVSPIPPPFLTSQIPIAEIELYVGMVEISNADIIDERSRSPFIGTITSTIFLQQIASDRIGSQSQNQTTGLTATDGFFSGIDANENALIWNYENTEILIGVNNSLSGKIAANGNWLITPESNDISPLNEIVIYNGTVGGECYAQFINDGTGVGEFNGFVVGVDTVERANVWNYENTDLVFATNSSFRGKIAANGNWLVSAESFDITPSRQLVIHDGGVGGSPYMQFINDTTGITGLDGFIIGMNPTNTVALWNYESTDMFFGIGGVARAKFASNGFFLLSHDGNDLTPQYNCVVYSAESASNSYAQFINDGTGNGITSGFIVGVNTTEQAELWNYHNSDLRFGTNNFFRGKIDNGGNWLISPDGTNLNPGHELVLYKNSNSSDCNIQFINSATGQGSADGFKVGIDSLEQATIWNQENTRMRFATFNTERMSIQADGSVEIGTGLVNQGAGTLNILNGVYVNNSELYLPSAISNFVGAQNIVMNDTTTVRSFFEVDTIIPTGIFESVGASGSGANNIWTALNVIPANAKAVILFCEVFVSSYNVVGSYKLSALLSGRKTGSTQSGTETRLSQADTVGYLSIASSTWRFQDSSYTQIILPIDGNGRFDLAWFASFSTTTGTPINSQQIRVYLDGWLE